jgi:hypothetical protein
MAVDGYNGGGTGKLGGIGHVELDRKDGKKILELMGC